MNEDTTPTSLTVDPQNVFRGNLRAALDEARHLRQEAGQSPEGRAWSVAAGGEPRFTGGTP